MVSKTQFFGQINNSTEGLFFDSISTPVSSIEFFGVAPFFQDPRHQLGLIKGLSISFSGGCGQGEFELSCYFHYYSTHDGREPSTDLGHYQPANDSCSYAVNSV